MRWHNGGKDNILDAFGEDGSFSLEVFRLVFLECLCLGERYDCNDYLWMITFLLLLKVNTIKQIIAHRDSLQPQIVFSRQQPQRVKAFTRFISFGFPSSEIGCIRGS